MGYIITLTRAQNDYGHHVHSPKKALPQAGPAPGAGEAKLYLNDMRRAHKPQQNAGKAGLFIGLLGQSRPLTAIHPSPGRPWGLAAARNGRRREEQQMPGSGGTVANSDGGGLVAFAALMPRRWETPMQGGELETDPAGEPVNGKGCVT